MRCYLLCFVRPPCKALFVLEDGKLCKFTMITTKYQVCILKVSNNPVTVAKLSFVAQPKAVRCILAANQHHHCLPIPIER